ncbi:hypothetical protein Tco_0843662 [Tanacetum coccineum]|uniref:Uncharacterized protein n=1 Tax=Tanacetum coccineum TaxID=301880 RepID=A0ABQ5B2X0_9ASTR
MSDSESGDSDVQDFKDLDMIFEYGWFRAHPQEEAERFYGGLPFSLLWSGAFSDHDRSMPPIFSLPPFMVRVDVDRCGKLAKFAAMVAVSSYPIAHLSEPQNNKMSMFPDILARLKTLAYQRGSRLMDIQKEKVLPPFE